MNKKQTLNMAEEIDSLQIEACLAKSISVRRDVSSPAFAVDDDVRSTILLQGAAPTAIIRQLLLQPHDWSAPLNLPEPGGRIIIKGHHWKCVIKGEME